MDKKRIQNLIIAVSFVLIAYFFIKVCVYHKEPFCEIESIIVAIITGIISGFLANTLFIRFQKINRSKSIFKILNNFEGIYNVYHWQDLSNPDNCFYKVNITLDKENAILKIHQTGNEPVHELFADVKMNESTFNYGEGNYSHPQKRGNPIGRIQLYLIGDGTINVDKYYLDDEGQKPGFEKWQWRKI